MAGWAVAADYELVCTAARGRLVVPVAINGSGEYPFLLDSCLQNPVMTPEAASASGLRQEYPSVGEAGARTPVVKVEGLSAAGIPAHALTVAVLDLAPLAARLGRPLSGVLPLYQPGLEVSVSFGDASVAWRPLDKARLEKPDHRTVRMVIDDSGAPTLPVLVNQQRMLRLQIDLARAGACGLPRRALEDMNLLRNDTPRLRTITGDGQRQTQIRLQSLLAASATLNTPVCTIIEDDAEPGWVGLGFLRHFRLTLNFEYGLVRLDNARQNTFEDPPIVGCGLTPGTFDGQYWHVNVAEDSSAWNAGIRTGDVLTAVNDRPLAGESADLAASLLTGPPGTPVACTMARDGGLATVTLSYEPLL
jgi:hypothetical protein